MPIIFHEESGEFHLYNKSISYIIKILPNKQLGNLYFGKVIKDRKSFSHLFQKKARPLSAYVFEDDPAFSLQHTMQEYPSYGTTDFRSPAFEIKQKNGSRISCFEYKKHEIFAGKNGLEGLPATYVEEPADADTLEITLYDELIKTELVLSYTIFNNYSAIARSARFINKGEETIVLERAMSASIDFIDSDFEMIQLSGAWSRERHIKTRKLQQGIQGVYSMRGISSAEHNPFIALKRPNTDENSGEVYGFSLIYSGNHLEQVEVDTHNMTRVMLGIHPDTFEWPLEKGEFFQTPEAIIVYSDEGLNKMSQTFHKLFSKHLISRQWRDKPRPVLINSWEATGANFTEEKLLRMAEIAKELGIELFVLDDGWFGNRDNDKAGLGDWNIVNRKKLPDGIEGLADKIESMGMKFGLWFEPESVNKDSNLYRKHPDWIIATPGRRTSASRNQYVLDFSRKEVVDYIYSVMEKVLSSAKISYVKWDMNRYITECYSLGAEAGSQGTVFHRYILGVYNLFSRLTERFPYILFEACSSGGARFDPGILYYAPQVWTSDNTDAIERLKIQYGTSLLYPISTMGAHVSEVPNQQVGRITPIETRANVAYFGVFGYELDLTLLTEEEKEKIKKQITFYKFHRELFLKGTFYRILSPFDGNETSWIVVSEDKSEAIAAYYKTLNYANKGWKRLKLVGLDRDKKYIIDNDNERYYYGDELMNVGIVLKDEELCANGNDFSSIIFYLKSI
ncbi:alpha-galactosidase 1 [Thermoclostridium stercorarium subsp. stercorarium DSM 8532]|uniref:Alpha-galactosidase n=2 Tax=Thermoclostridium stercorarium TaxID=1510 RepID=L7VPP0_THES1|nr:alpha-galactosidase [Thermoclostridium stercorarium]AGC68629.1 alpha-galactosidase 1 [Thermoclostridium stercorarium subsp. stercorarium DSM 8532]AGI39641.1 AgaA [Thermoclostridium stercorarium subsp. stercorarium DSM 8532]ANW98971.1 alpha-galactosidase [Thermoclostridium stercorarium subsp. thermolacticum DSM 2910]